MLFIWQQAFLKASIIQRRFFLLLELLPSLFETINKCHYHWRRYCAIGKNSLKSFSLFVMVHISQHLDSTRTYLIISHTVLEQQQKIQNRVVDYRTDRYYATGYLFFPSFCAFLVLAVTVQKGQWYFTFSAALVWDKHGVKHCPHQMKNVEVGVLMWSLKG